MFRVAIESTTDFRRLLSTKDSAAVTFRVRSKQLSIMIASTEIIVIYHVKEPVDCEDCSFAVNRESFLRLYRSGDFAVDVNGSTVTVYFYDANGALTHSADFLYLQDAESLYVEMLHVLESGGGEEIGVGDILPMVRLAIAQQASLQVRNYVATIVLNNNLKVFKPVGTRVSFSIRPDYLRHLVNNQTVWYKVQQYVCTKNGNLTYICATDRLSDCDSEYSMVHGGYNLAVKLRMFVGIKPLRELVNSHFVFDSMMLDLDSRQLVLDGMVKCRILLEITDLKRTSDFNVTELQIPKSILGILGIFGDKVMLTHRKQFISLSDTSGVEVYFN